MTVRQRKNDNKTDAGIILDLTYSRNNRYAHFRDEFLYRSAYNQMYFEHLYRGNFGCVQKRRSNASDASDSAVLI